jgi:DNA-directed RNA polymerase sigma subunit (sigma70/sigma32)
MRENDMTTALVTTLQNTPLSAGNLDAYIRQIHSIPVLSGEEERELALRLEQQDGT